MGSLQSSPGQQQSHGAQHCRWPCCCQAPWHGESVAAVRALDAQAVAGPSAVAGTSLIVAIRRRPVHLRHRILHCSRPTCLSVSSDVRPHRCGAITVEQGDPSAPRTRFPAASLLTAPQPRRWPAVPLRQRPALPRLRLAPPLPPGGPPDSRLQFCGGGKGRLVPLALDNEQ